MVDLRRAAAIVGVHEHVTRYAPDKSELQIQGESIIKALEDAGLSKKDVDGLFTASMSVRNSGLNLADYLNMYPKHVDNTTVGGGSFEFHLAHALNAIHAGRINCRPHHLRHPGPLRRRVRGHRRRRDASATRASTRRPTASRSCTA